MDKAQMLDKKTIFTFAFDSKVLSGCTNEQSYVVAVAKPESFVISDDCTNRYDGKPIVCPGGETEVTLYASNGIAVGWDGMTKIDADGATPANYDCNNKNNIVK